MIVQNMGYKILNELIPFPLLSLGYINKSNMIRTQPQRAIILIIYIGILFVLNYFAFENWMPDRDFKGLWFYTGIASILLGNLYAPPSPSVTLAKEGFVL